MKGRGRVRNWEKRIDRSGQKGTERQTLIIKRARHVERSG